VLQESGGLIGLRSHIHGWDQKKRIGQPCELLPRTIGNFAMRSP
jgi:hypothetical protein